MAFGGFDFDRYRGSIWRTLLPRLCNCVCAQRNQLRRLIHDIPNNHCIYLGCGLDGFYLGLIYGGTCCGQYSVFVDAWTRDGLVYKVYKVFEPILPGYRCEYVLEYFVHLVCVENYVVETRIEMLLIRWNQ